MKQLHHIWGIIFGAFGAVLIAALVVSPASSALFQVITINPTTLPTGQIGVLYDVTITATGGTPPYTYSLNGEFPTELTFNNGTGQITGIVSGVGTVNFQVVVVDSAGNTATRDYSLSFTETGAPPAPTVDATAFSGDAIQATRDANLRLALGEPRAEISDEIDGLAIRTGPFVGASLRNLALPNEEYPILGEFRPPGSRYTWYLIQYEVNTSVDFGIDQPPIILQGWISGRFAQAKGFLPDIPTLGNPFDNLEPSSVSLPGVSILKSNIYRYPAGSAPLITRFDEGSTFQAIGRTVIDRRDFTYWILIRLDSTGQVGWTRYTPFFLIDGDLDTLPTY